MNNRTDSELITEVLTGNTPAFGTLVNRYKDKAFTLAYNIVTNREDAEEIAQDTFIKVFKALHSFNGQSLFSTWLYRIVANTALNKRKLKKPALIEINDCSIEEHGSENIIYRVWQKEEASDKKKLIQQALLFLRDEERICLTLFYINEFSIADIHQLTNITAANIKVIMHRGRKHLYEELVKILGKEIDSLL